jgi:hypothetical protein
LGSKCPSEKVPGYRERPKGDDISISSMIWIQAVGYNKCTHQVMTAENHAKLRDGEYGSGDDRERRKINAGGCWSNWVDRQLGRWEGNQKESPGACQ